jgi:hypothetical protein
MLLEFEVSTNIMEEKENCLASENNFFRLAADFALPRQEPIAGWCAATR